MLVYQINTEAIITLRSIPKQTCLCRVLKLVQASSTIGIVEMERAKGFLVSIPGFCAVDWLTVPHANIKLHILEAQKKTAVSLTIGACSARARAKNLGL